MDKRTKTSRDGGNWIGVGTAIGVAVFAATNEPVWIAVGVAVGAAIEREATKINRTTRKYKKTKFAFF